MSCKQLRKVYFQKVRGSEVLKAYLDHFDRLAEDDPDKTYKYLSNITDKVIRETRERLNRQALESGTIFDTRKAMPGVTPQHDDPKGTGKPRKTKGDGKGGNSKTKEVN